MREDEKDAEHGRGRHAIYPVRVRVSDVCCDSESFVDGNRARSEK